MKHIQIYEDYSGAFDFQDKCTSAALYLEEMLNISNDDGFEECLFGESEKNKTIFTFYFQLFTEEETYDKFYDFLKKYKLKVSSEYVNNYKTFYEINVYLSKYQVNKFADLYDTTKKYNL